MIRKRLLYFIVFVVLGVADAAAGCPCLSVFCPCCIDRCRLGFIKIPRDGCRDRGGTENYGVVIRSTLTNAYTYGFQGQIDYNLAKAVWSGGGYETASAIGSAARELGYTGAEANCLAIADGRWSGKQMTQAVVDELGGGARPYMQFAPLVVASGTANNGKGTIGGGLHVLDLSNGTLWRQNTGLEGPHGTHIWVPLKGFAPIGTVQLLNDPGRNVSEAYLNLNAGRKNSTATPHYYDFRIDAKNDVFYLWYSCTTSSNCMLMFAVALIGVVVAPFVPFVGVYLAAAALTSMVVQAFGVYCGIYACNKQCTKGTISVATTYYVRFDTTPVGEPVGTDVVLNGVSLVSRLDVQRDGSGNLALSSRHYHGPVVSPEGTPLSFLVKGTLIDLGDPSIQPEPETSARQMKLLLTPPQSPEDLLPGVLFGVDRRN